MIYNIKKNVGLLFTLFFCTSLFAQIDPSKQKTNPQKQIVVDKKATDKDSDGDGIVDSQDKCPYKKGSTKNNGCPVQGRTIGKMPQMIFVAGGTFKMGTDDEGYISEKPAHNVTVRSFSIGKYEVTVEEFKMFCKAKSEQMPATPSWGWVDNYPIEVNFNAAVAYCNWLSEKSGKVYRLPTEAEWEYAAKGGKNSLNYTFIGSNDNNEVSWDYSNSGDHPHAIGSKKANELGIFDMGGNVTEWCKDWWSQSYYENSPVVNPTGPTAAPLSGEVRCARGYHYSARSKSGYKPFYRSNGYIVSKNGFRVVLEE